MQFIDRSSEISRPETVLQRKRSGFVALWGRRRVGKTRLLLEWCARHEGVYTVADQSAEQVQRRYFAEAVAERFTGFSEVDYPDWRSVFRALAREATRVSWHGPLVVDEFPYMVNSCPSLPSVLQSWLDHEAKGAGLLVAIAGSTQHMMQGLALDSSSSLYGRTVESIVLQPMSAGHIGAALSLKDPMDCVRVFTIWGGIPGCLCRSVCRRSRGNGDLME